MREGVAFVTGASQGIGEAIARRFAEDGYAVALAARSDTTQLADELGDALAVECDVTDEASVESAIDATLSEYGGLDVLVNNAGIAGPTQPVETVEREEWSETIETNLTGPFLCAKHAASALRDSDDGSIVNVSSVGGKRPYPNRSPYAASKLGLVGLGRTLAAEFGADGVTVNTICPGPVAGDRIETVIEKQADARGTTPEAVKQDEYLGDLMLDEMVTPEEVADVAYRLAVQHRHVTAQDVNVDAGMTWY
ncbi:SDR family NAD(P)-dependent oxidoreductase [Salarchaeum japonicum]|uniref:SDR family oxidoreductase n=1 Tax=Salarchaeum japonicum TaxID=555573 RepID=A0AAV3T3P0_9EURY|nr:SDR family oxidoreductase [Salarchaeum japonicum]